MTRTDSRSRTTRFLTLTAGTYAVSPDTAHVPDGYVLSAESPASYTVTVNESGAVSPRRCRLCIRPDFPDGLRRQKRPPRRPQRRRPRKPEDIASQYPDYLAYGLYATTNETGVRLRTSPHIYSDNLAFQVEMGTEVYVHGVFTGTNDIQWAYIRYSNTDCYVWLSLLDFDALNPTPSPTPTPSPDAVPDAQADGRSVRNLSGLYRARRVRLYQHQFRQSSRGAQYLVFHPGPLPGADGYRSLGVRHLYAQRHALGPMSAMPTPTATYGQA